MAIHFFKNSNDNVVLVCNTTEQAFGPVFRNEEVALDFVAFCNDGPNRDPRNYSRRELSDVHSLFCKTVSDRALNRIFKDSYTIDLDPEAPVTLSEIEDYLESNVYEDLFGSVLSPQGRHKTSNVISSCEWLLFLYEHCYLDPDVCHRKSELNEFEPTGNLREDCEKLIYEIGTYLEEQLPSREAFTLEDDPIRKNGESVFFTDVVEVTK